MSRHPYPVRVSTDGEAAVWDPDLNLWCSTTGARLSAAQVADWMPYATFPELDTEGGPADQIARILDGAVLSRNIDDAETSRALRDAIVHTLRSKHMLTEDPGVLVLAATLAEWAAHWPPRTGDDIDESVYDQLGELNADELEKLAHAASELSRHAWNARHEKMTEAAREREGITWASVTVDPGGPLRADSVVTVGDASAPVPERTQLGNLGGQRLAVALRTLGYRPVNLSDGILENGVIRFLVRKVSAGE